MTRLTLDYVKHRLNEINSNLEILDSIYVNNNTPLTVRCNKCGNIQKTKWQNLQYNKGCKQCGIKKRSGNNSPKWKGGVTEMNTFFRDQLSTWKTDTLKKYNFKCDITGSIRIVIHHLYPFHKIVSEVFNITNLDIRKQKKDYTEEELNILSTMIVSLHYKYGLGVCIDEKLHHKFHSTYGDNADIKQYKEFKRNIINNCN